MQIARARGTESWLSQRLRSFVFASRGLARLCKEPNARIHAIATVAVVVAGALARFSAGEWTAVVLAITAVWVAEALNTAFEALADAVVPEQHPLIAVAKDVAASGVLVAAIGAASVALIVVGPRLMALF